MSDLGNKEIFSKNLQYYMNINNKDRNEVARDLNIPYSTLADWYNGNKYPRIDKIQLLADYFNIKKSDLVESRNNILKKNRIPVLGKIPAGIPIEMIEDVIDYEEISDEMLKGDREYFGLRVSGDSMTPKYLDGDVLIVQKADDCESGQDCIVMVNGNDGTFKRVIKNKDGIILQPLNPNYEIKFYSNDDIEKLPIKILGVVKEIRRTV